MTKEATLWYDTCRLLAKEAELEGNMDRLGEANNLSCIVGCYLQEHQCADEQDREEIEYELRMAVEAIRPRVLGLIADREDGGQHTIINQQPPPIKSDVR